MERENCLKNSQLAFTSLIMIQISEHSPILSQICNVYRKTSPIKAENLLISFFDLYQACQVVPIENC